MSNYANAHPVRRIHTLVYAIATRWAIDVNIAYFKPSFDGDESMTRADEDVCKEAGYLRTVPLLLYQYIVQSGIHSKLLMVARSPLSNHHMVNLTGAIGIKEYLKCRDSVMVRRQCIEDPRYHVPVSIAIRRTSFKSSNLSITMLTIPYQGADVTLENFQL
ncbi:uncharacterized protein FIBRA_05605 [Fibroporia radiculosa]|uniref:Uncharacterized protein n=1 Tax=Fibroporia radiculosa TaxID=599839 RepID=J4HXT8_9APHY|nr:uncharacterized protein FIBRA_05605 [Fibroporia radiculosa]CCM03472.1 predicted protein [Fibroporia radiculosa]